MVFSMVKKAHDHKCLEKNKEFWVYEGSETIEPFRETVKWVVFRSAMPISSEQVSRRVVLLV